MITKIDVTPHKNLLIQAHTRVKRDLNLYASKWNQEQYSFEACQLLQKGVEISAGYFFIDFAYNIAFLYDSQKSSVTGAKLNLNGKPHVLESASASFILDQSLFVDSGVFFKHSLGAQPVF